MLCVAWLLAAAPGLVTGELREHVEALASDDFAGRETGSAGGRLAAEYIAAGLEAAGASPAGDAGTFFQAVPVVQWVQVAAPTLELHTEGGESVAASFGEFTARAREPLDGVLEVKVVEGPEDLPAPRSDLALFMTKSRSRWTAWLDEGGAAGGRGYGLVIYETRLKSSGAWSAARPRWGLDGPSTGPINELAVRDELAERFESGEVLRIAVDLKLRAQRLAASNVVAVVPGSEPESGETVLVSAHYDHLGTREPEEEGADTVYNGADDNASGVAFTIELARAMAAEPPKRNVVFLLVTGEERGLLGMRHYVDHPVVPLAETLFNFNLEMLGRPDDLAGGSGRMWLTGWERTSLGGLIEAAGCSVIGDPRPEQGFYRRSDNYPLAKAGVVAQTFSSFGMHDDYHRASDEADTLDYEHMDAALATCATILRQIAGGSWSPQWLEGGRP